MQTTDNSSAVPARAAGVTASKDELIQAWKTERQAARDARRTGDAKAEWRFLERAHIISQPMAAPHVRTHLAMLGYGLRHRDGREIVGQLVRIVVAAPGSLTGKYPVWNTGAARVNALRPMPIPNDLRAMLEGRESASENR